MTTEQLLYAIGGVGEDLVADASVRPRKRRAWPRRLASAAVFALVLTGALRIAQRLDYFSFGCSAWPGTIIGDAYYYNVSHSGLWQWTEKHGNEKLFGKLWTDGWLVTEDAYYYSHGLTLYRQDRHTGKKTKLFRLSRADATHFGYEIAENGSLILTVYHKTGEYKYQLRVDALTGELLETLTGRISYADRFTLLWTERYPEVDTRDLELVDIGGDEYTHFYDLRENGVSILPKGTCVSKYARSIGAYTAYALYPADAEERKTRSRTDSSDLLLLRPDGNDAVISAPPSGFQDAAGDWLYYVHQEDGVNGVLYSVGVYNMVTGEARELTPSEPWQFYSLETDGNVMYTCVPWGKAHTRWRLEYDAKGGPVALTLLDADICVPK